VTYGYAQKTRNGSDTNASDAVVTPSSSSSDDLKNRFGRYWDRQQTRFISMPLRDKELTKQEQEALNLQLCKGTIDANIPFRWVESVEMQKVFEILRPNVTLPREKALRTKCLDDLYDVSVKEDDARLQQCAQWTLNCDGWKNISKQSLLGFMAVTDQREYIPINMIDVSNEEKSGVLLEAHLIKQLEDLELRFGKYVLNISV
jgi:hypothetical protein